MTIFYKSKLKPITEDENATPEVLKLWRIYNLIFLLGIFVPCYLLSSLFSIDLGTIIERDFIFPVTLISIILAGGLFYLFLRRSQELSPNYRGVKEQFLVLILSLIFLPLLLNYCFILSNKYFDTSKPVTHQVDLLDKRNSNRNSTYTSTRLYAPLIEYEFVVTSWRPDRERIKFEVPIQTLINTTYDTKLNVVTREGFWGKEWVEDAWN